MANSTLLSFTPAPVVFLDGLSPTGVGSLVAGVVTLIAIVIRLLTPRGPNYAKFPLASLDGEDPKSSWFHQGRKLMIVALEKVSLALDPLTTITTAC